MGILILNLVCLGIAGTYELSEARRKPEKPFFKKYWRSLVLCISTFLALVIASIEKQLGA